MSTAGSLILSAYQMIGYYSPNETMSAADSSLGLDQLNKLLDSWSNETLTCYTITEQSTPLTIGKTSYTIGTSGTPDINATRPIRIIEGPGVAYIQDSNLNNYPVDVVTRDRWNQIANRGSTITSNIPNMLFYDPKFPLGVINIWPSPNLTYTLFFDSYLQLGQLSSLTTSLSLPPGYELALQSSLAILLAPFVKNAMVSQDIKDIARVSKANIKRSNKRSTTANFDSEITASGKASYNIYSGSYNR